MIKIRVHKSGAGKITQILSIADNPTPGTWGSHQLLLEQLKREDEDWIEWDGAMPGISMGRFKQLHFNTQFLEYILAKYGELHCEYCGKPHLKIYSWKEKPGKDVATADHFHARSTNKHLAFNRQNLLVSCGKCNWNKGKKVGEIGHIRFYYPEDKLWSYYFKSEWNPGNNPVSLNSKNK